MGLREYLHLSKPIVVHTISLPMIKSCRASEKIRHVRRDHSHLLLDTVASVCVSWNCGDNLATNLKKNLTQRKVGPGETQRRRIRVLIYSVRTVLPLEFFVLWGEISLYCLRHFGLQLLLLAAKGTLMDTICFVSGRGFSVRQRFSTSVLQEFLKHAIPDYLVWGTDLFSLRLLNKKMTTANTTVAVQCEWIKIIPIFLSDRRILVISLCAMRWKRLKTAGVRGWWEKKQIVLLNVRWYRKTKFTPGQGSLQSQVGNVKAKVFQGEARNLATKVWAPSMISFLMGTYNWLSVTFFSSQSSKWKKLKKSSSSTDY